MELKQSFVNLFRYLQIRLNCTVMELKLNYANIL